MTSTEIPRASAKPKDAPAISQTTVAISPMPMTTGTKTPDTLSASLATGALVAAASLTIRMICERAVSSPTFVASHRRNPD